MLIVVDGICVGVSGGKGVTVAVTNNSVVGAKRVGRDTNTIGVAVGTGENREIILLTEKPTVHTTGTKNKKRISHCFIPKKRLRPHVLQNH